MLCIEIFFLHLRQDLCNSKCYSLTIMKELIIETKVSVYDYSELSESYRSLVDAAKEQVMKSYSPYSEFRVGAAVELANGEVFAASNQENAAYPSGLCAERTAVFFANAQYPDVSVRTIAIAAYTEGDFLTDPITPCGACRQVLLETENRYGEDMVLLLYGKNGVQVIEGARSLLPLSFKLVRH